jgi:hypothetical protein
MDNTSSDEDIGSDNLCAIYEDAAIVDGDGQIPAINSWNDSAVLKTTAVSNGAVHNVVCQDVGSVGSAEVGQTGTNSLESCVRGCEDGHVPKAVDSADEVGSIKRACQGGQTGGHGSLGSALGQSEYMVDDVNHTTGEVNVLRVVSRSSCCGMTRCTHGSGDGGVV